MISISEIPGIADVGMDSKLVEAAGEGIDNDVSQFAAACIFEGADGKSGVGDYVFDLLIGVERVNVKLNLFAGRISQFIA